MVVIGELGIGIGALHGADTRRFEGFFTAQGARIPQTALVLVVVVVVGRGTAIVVAMDINVVAVVIIVRPFVAHVPNVLYGNVRTSIAGVFQVRQASKFGWRRTDPGKYRFFGLLLLLFGADDINDFFRLSMACGRGVEIVRLFRQKNLGAQKFRIVGWAIRGGGRWMVAVAVVVVVVVVVVQRFHIFRW